MATIDAKRGVAGTTPGGDTSKRIWEGHLANRKPSEVYQLELERVGLVCSLARDNGANEELAKRVINLHRTSLRRLIKSVQARAHGGNPETMPETEPVKVLFAPTSRVIDYKAGPEVIKACINALVSSRKVQELLSAINDGPGEGKAIWENPSPTTPVELVASIVRWAVLGNGEKKRIRVADHLRKWILDVAKQAGIADLSPRLGGVSAVGAVTANALRHTATMMALGTIPPDVAAQLPPKIKVVGDSGKVQTVDELVRDDSAVGNIAFLIPKGEPDIIAALPGVNIGGQTISHDSLKHLDCLITGSTAVQGFGSLSDTHMRTLGSEHDLIILTGFQAISSTNEIEAYFKHVVAAREAGIPTALLYSEPRKPDIELLALKKLAEIRPFEFLGINGIESVDLLKRISSDSKRANTLGLSDELKGRLVAFSEQQDSSSPIWGNTKDHPERVLAGAKLLQEILGLPLVRVRGRHVDLLIGAKDFDLGSKMESPDQTRTALQDVILNLSSSRLLGAIKVATSGGLITKPEHVTQLRNLPEGLTLAALLILDEAIDRDYRAGNPSVVGAERSTRLAEHFVSLLADGRRVAAVPPVDFHDKTGGTVSAGDTMDACFLVESMDLLRQAFSFNRDCRS